ncbi:hypothetical protein JCM15519_05910 [Fundidesulfovibrio butyratiphilus]
MDAAFFRFLGPEIGRLLGGARFETVYCPAPGFWTLAFSPPVTVDLDPESAPCAFVLLRAHPQKGALFLSSVKPANPPAPPMRAMWLRKRLRSRRVCGHVCDWRKRTLALELCGGGWLLLSMESDPDVTDALPEDFGHFDAWPSPEDLLADPAAPRSLRRALEREDEPDRPRALASFLSGRAAGFYLPQSEKQPVSPLPWPEGRECVRYPSALQAASAHGDWAFFSALAPAVQDEAKLRARADRRLKTLDADAKRLEGLVARQAWGEAIAANLSGLDGRAKVERLELDHPELGHMDLALDPSRTVVENMERFFRQAAKGRRGLGHVDRLRADVLEGRLPPPRSRVGHAGDARMRGAEKKCSDKKGKSGKGKDIPLRRFRTSDGFAVLRGRNAAANHRLLSEVARPYDYWFHARGGPGAHVILRRDNPGASVPERSMEEAAALAGLASWQAGAAKAEVIWAEAGAVRKIKGAPLGQVRLDAASTILAVLEPDLEERLSED